jgi:hypothetical protein
VNVGFHYRGVDAEFLAVFHTECDGRLSGETRARAAGKITHRPCRRPGQVGTKAVSRERAVMRGHRALQRAAHPHRQGVG